MVRYYALRRLNPYRGVVQVVEAEDAAAHSHDGLTWHLRADDGYGWVRPTGVWVEGEGLKAGTLRRHEALLEALRQRPALPFPLADHLELWLLDKASGVPLALLDAARASHGPGGAGNLEWHPFVQSYTGFRAQSLASGDKGATPSAHRDFLARLVNQAARPYPAAQWFHRQLDGSGTGLEGARLQPEWEARTLPAGAFPELLVRSHWNSLLEQSVIKDYYDWLSALLLLLPGISQETRRWLEEAACLRPRALYRVHRLLPRRFDDARIQAALVAARLEQTSGPETENDLY